MEREDGREREGTEALGVGRGNRDAMSMPLGGSWRGNWGEAVGTAPAPCWLHPNSCVHVASVLLPIVFPLPRPGPRSDTSSWECVFSTVSLFCYLFFILLASTSGDLVVRRIQPEAAQTLYFHCSARL